MEEIEIVKLYVKEPGSLVLLFSNGVFKRFLISSLFNNYPQYQMLNDYMLFKKCKLLANYIVKWNDDLDLTADTLYELSENCEQIESPTTLLLGYKMKKIRLEKDLSQKELSCLTGIDQADISKFENGLSNPSIEYIEKIATGLGKTLEIKIK